MNGLVGCWPLDDSPNSSTGVAITMREIHSALTVSNSGSNPTRTTGIGAMPASQFVAASSIALTRTSDSFTQMGDIDFMCSAWFYLDSTGINQYIMTKQSNAAPGFEWRIGLGTANQLRFVGFDGTNVVADKTHSTVLTTATWYFGVAYHSATSNEVGVSLNGGAYETAATTGAPATTSTEFRISSRAGDGAFPWDGRIAQCMIAKGRIWSAEEVSWLYNGGLGRKYPFV